MASKFIGAQPGEVFVGNTDTPEVPKHLAGLRTARVGETALDIDGKRLPPNYRPIFIGESDHDAHERIMNGRLSAVRRGFCPDCGKSERGHECKV